MMELNYWKSYWPLDEGRCPCDVHLVEYIEKREIRGKAIFHFGTGHHHIVGIKNLDLDRPNEILGITASREEHASYVDLVIKNPRVGLHYKVLFADLYTLHAALLPRFDVITLFHLGEFHTEANRAYTEGNDGTVLWMFVETMNPGALMLLYTRSRGSPEAAILAGEAVRAGVLEALEEYKSLKIYRKPT
jgi:hypothetical protein